MSDTYKSYLVAVLCF
ncbi:DUF1270 family protein, partial [Staphylococcus aureus]|nr:DUF1270 family protein [Staphylococcus aureus]